jgi:Na+-driven multidrug efflux pump
LAVCIVPSLWSGLFTADPGVRAAANLYLGFAGPGFAFVGLGMALYFASQGSGKVLGPVLAATVRLTVIAGGGWMLAATAAPVWTLFGLVALSMLAYGLTTAAAVYVTSWGGNTAR